jgi:arylsulfatase
MALGRKVWLGVMALFVAVGVSMPAVAQQQQKPNIVFIMGDDIGWANIGVYNQGVMAGRTPEPGPVASQGMRFTDYYAEASCTAGRANFITGNYRSAPG